MKYFYDKCTTSFFERETELKKIVEEKYSNIYEICVAK